VSEHRKPVDIAIAFTEAWTSHDMTTAATYVADEVVFEGPMTRAVGASDYLNGLAEFARVVTGLTTLTALGDDQRAMVMYEITGPFGRLRAGEEFEIADGKIVRDTLVFDTYEIRRAREAQAKQ
jgi:hypothetical protein